MWENRYEQYLFSQRLTLSQTTNFRLFKLKEFADDNSNFDKSGWKFSKRVENTGGKREFADYEQFLLFSHSVLKGLVLQTRKNQGLFGKGWKVWFIAKEKKKKAASGNIMYQILCYSQEIFMTIHLMHATHVNVCPDMRSVQGNVRCQSVEM